MDELERLELMTLPRSTEEWNEWLEHTKQRHFVNPSRLEFVTVTGMSIMPVQSDGLRHFAIRRFRQNSFAVALCGRAVVKDEFRIERTCQPCSDLACSLKVA